MAWFEKGELGQGSVRSIKQALTILPRKMAGGDDVLPIECWAETSAEIGVPRTYLFEHAKQSHHVTWSLADGFPCQYESAIRYEGAYAEQSTAVDALVRWFRYFDENPDAADRGIHLGAILRADPGFGKSNVALAVAHALGMTTLISVHTERLMEQWIARAEKYLPGVKVGVVRQDKCQFKGMDIVVAMVESIASDPGRYPVELFSWSGLLIVDEVHRISAKSWSETVKLFRSKFRLGVSATPRRKDGTADVFWWHIGQIRYDAKTERPKPSVRFTVSHARDQEGIVESNAPDAIVLRTLTRLTERNKVIVGEVVKALRSPAERKIMVLSDRVEHLQELDAMLKRACRHFGIDGITTGFYMGAADKGRTPVLRKGYWPNTDAGREKAADLIYQSLSRRRDRLAWKDADGVRRIGPESVPVDELPLADLFLIASRYDVAQKSRAKKVEITAEELRQAERARVIWATFAMCCVDVDTEVHDPLTGETKTVRDCIQRGDRVRVVSGRNECEVVVPSGAGSAGRKECVEIVVGGTGKSSLVVTPDHMVWTQRGWVEAGRLLSHGGRPTRCPGDYVATPRKLSVKTCRTTLSVDDAWLLGLLIADGSLSCPDRGIFGFTSGDEDLAEEVDKVLRSHGMRLVKERHQHWSTRVIGGSSGAGKKSWLRRELERLGMCRVAKDKTVPLEIMLAPEDVANAFVGGYLDGDGCVDGRAVVSFSSVSRPMINQVKALLLRASIPTKDAVCDKNGCWKVSLGRRESSDVRGLIPMRLRRKKFRVCSHDARRLGIGDFTMVPPQMGAEIVRKGRIKGFRVKDMASAAGVSPVRLSTKPIAFSRDQHDAICRLIGEPLMNDALAWLPVRSVTVVGERDVGDFSVPPDKSWVASGIIVHNSEGFDLPAIDTIGFASPLSDVEQAYGRARRVCVPVAHGGEMTPDQCEHYCPWRAAACKGKPKPVAFDVIDPHSPLSRRRLGKRLAFYRRVGAEVGPLDRST